MSNIVALPMSRKNIRDLVKVVREAMNIQSQLYFPIVEFLEYCQELIGYNMIILPDSELPEAYAITCIEEQELKIRESVYIGAIEKNPRDRFTLCHELGHILLHSKKRISKISLARANENVKIPSYINPEWQANTFAGELLAPAYLIKGYTVEEIAHECKISKQAAAIQLCYAH